MKSVWLAVLLCASAAMADEAPNVHVIEARPVRELEPPVQHAPPELLVVPPFVKGELTSLGTDRLQVPGSRFGLRAGYAHLDNASWLAITPEIDLHFNEDVALGLGVPLHVRAYSHGFIDHQGYHLRGQDYSTAADYVRLLRFFTVGKKEDHFFLNVSQQSAASIGHGTIVRRYFGNTDLNVTRVGAQLDAYGRWGGVEALVGDIARPNHFVAGLAFLRPLAAIPGGRLSETSLGVSAAADFAAPYKLARNALGYPLVGDSDLCGSPSQPPGSTCTPGEPVAAETRRAQVVGVDLETKVLKTARVDLKPYLDHSRLMASGGVSGGGGTTLGVLGRFNAGWEKVHAFRTVVEARYFDGNYLPGYFDTFYEVQKYQFVTGRADTGYDPKLATILARDPSHKRAGFYLEGTWQYDGGFAVTAALESSFHVAGPAALCASCSPAAQAAGARNLTLHIEYPASSWLQFFGSYYRRTFDGSPTGGPIIGDNTLVMSAVRLHVLPILFLNLRAYRSWQPDPVLGELRNVWGGDVDLELGYEFDKPRRTTRL